MCRAFGSDRKAQKWPSGISVEMDETDTCWLIVSGTVDVFYLPLIGGNSDAHPAHGKRYHLMRISDGGVLFGLPSEGRVVAVPSGECKVLPLSTTLLFQPSVKGAERQILSDAINAGFNRLADAICSGMAPRKTTLLVGDEKQLKIENSTALQAIDQTVWISGSGSFLLNGTALIEVDNKPFPLVSPTWLVSTDALHIDVSYTSDMLAQGKIEKCIASAQQLYLQIFIARIGKEREHVVQDMSRREVLQKDKVSRAVHDLASVVGQKFEMIEDLSSNHLIAACQYIATEMDITVKIPHGGAEALAKSKDPLGLISRVSGFRTRMVKLEGAWWKNEHGHLLAFLGKENEPCAIIPNGKGGYALINPRGKTVALVDKEVASSIGSHAFMFYSPLPSETMRPKDMLVMGLKGRGKDGWIILAIVLLTGILSMATPIVTEQVMATVIPEAQYDQLWILGIALIGIAISSTAFSLAQSVAVLRVEGMMDNRMQSAVWDHLLRLPSSFFRRFTVGDLSNRAQGVDGIRQLFTSSAVSSLIAAVTGTFSLILMFYYDAYLALVVATLSAFIALFTFIMGRKAVARNREYLERRGDVMTDVLQYLNAIAKLRVCGVESDAFALWSKKYAGTELVSMEQKSKMNAVAVANSVFSFVAVAAIMIVIALQGKQLFAFFLTPDSWKDIDAATLTHVMSAATFIAFNVAYGQFASAIGLLANQSIALSMIKPLYDRLRPILEAEKENCLASIDPGELSGEIEIKDVHFRYCKDTSLVLRGLSMQVEAGSFVALVGPSGAGKSSLLRLLLAFDVAESGSVFLDGKDITQLETQALRRNFGVVLQNGQLFAGSVFDNITAGSNLSMDDAWWAARMAGLDKDIEAMPMGMHTVLSEGAGTFSGGQRQRLMIARAIIHHPKILLFDEATSALDNETQAIVSKSLESMNCTRIVIAHRLSTVRKADRIFVVDAGQVAESGTYDSLMNKRGIFFDLAQRQIA